MNYLVFSKNKNRGFTPTPKSLAKNFGVSLQSKRGFTLVELIVVMAISSVILTSLIINQTAWNNKLKLRTTAYGLVMMIRQAQIYSLGVREDTTGTESDKFAIGYGIQVASAGSTSGYTYMFFADRFNNHVCDKDCKPTGAPASNELLKPWGDPWPAGISVDRICSHLISPPGTWCKNNTNKLLDITFLRPDTKAYRVIGNGHGDPPPSGDYVTVSQTEPAFIVLTNGTDYATIEIDGNGQISLQ